MSVVRISIVAVRSVIDNSSGEHVAGSREIPHRLQLIWTLGLFSTAHDPWRLLASTNPTTGIRDLPYKQPDHPDEQPLGTNTIEFHATGVEQLNAGEPRNIDSGDVRLRPIPPPTSPDTPAIRRTRQTHRSATRS